MSPSIPPNQPPVVVFDFDGTLVSRDSFVDFSWRYCARRPARWLTVMLALPLSLLLLLLRSEARAASVLLWAMTVLAPTRSFVLALRRYAVGTLPRFANPAIFEELAQRLAQGERVVIATGSVPTLVRGLLRARGMPALPVAGSRFRRKWGGLVVLTHCTEQTKLIELERKFGIRAWSAVYTDSFADRYLLRAAPEITLVGPSRRTLRRTRALRSSGATLRVLAG